MSYKARDIARLLTAVSKTAGRRKFDRSESARARSDRLVVCGYVHACDPFGWHKGPGPGPVATVLLERQGGPEDCEPPHNYYGPDPLPEVPGLVFEPVNAAVILVYAFDPESVGVHYGDPCPVCARRGFHAAGCPEKG